VRHVCCGPRGLRHAGRKAARDTDQTLRRNPRTLAEPGAEPIDRDA
jgi:hypothetical protein